MTDATLDGRGRLTLPKEIGERHGDTIVSSDEASEGFADRLDRLAGDE